MSSEAAGLGAVRPPEPLVSAASPGIAGLSPSQAADAASGRKNMSLLVQLRWIAICGQILTIAVVQVGLGIALPLVPMAAVLVGLVLLNVVSLVWLQRSPAVTGGGLFMVIILDVAALTAQLSLSGGVQNPFTSLYLLQVTLGAVLLGFRPSCALIGVVAGAVAFLAAFDRPLVLPAGGHDLFDLYIVGELVGLALNAGLLVVFVARISRNLRERDSGLAAMRQHAAEEDHIVRMGLLASGAAHELGTPLSSVSVILGDWLRVPELAANAEIVDEIREMQAEIGRCKAIVTGILLAAGAARGEQPHVTSVSEFMAGLVDEWCRTHAPAALGYRNTFGDDLPIVSDTALKQVVFNVLDNAFEVSPDRVDLVASREHDTLVLRIADAGPGFAPEMLAQLGKPYLSSKGRLGGGLGLFLVVNVVRKLGGSVEAANRPEGGAVVTLRLPLATLAVEEEANGFRHRA